jgi:hypothetical protein
MCVHACVCVHVCMFCAGGGWGEVQEEMGSRRSRGRDTEHKSRKESLSPQPAGLEKKLRPKEGRDFPKSLLRDQRLQLPGEAGDV